MDSNIKEIPSVRQHAASGFNIWGLLGLMAGIFLLIIILLPSIGSNNGRHASRVVCTTQMKQISLAMLLWAEDHQTNFPMHVSFTNGGSKELTLRGWVAPTFWAISNELQIPKAATCPDDKRRLPRADAFSSLTDRKISYFLNPSAAIEKPDAVLLGDRHVATNGVALPAGLVQIHDPQTVSWTTNIHRGQGNISLADGSAHQVTSKGLRDLLKPTMIVTNTLVIP